MAFLRKRVLRIYPAFIVATLLGVFLVGPLSSDRGMTAVSDISVPNVAWNVLTLDVVTVPGSFPNNPFQGAINGSLWSIRYEFWGYLGVLGLGMIPILSRGRSFIFGIFRSSQWALC